MDDLDLRERMERLSRRVDGAAAPDLYAVRERHARRRTRSALVVGLGVAVLGAFLAASVLRPGPARVPSEVPDWELPEPATVWPALDTPSDLAWRQDPEQLIRRFAATVLGWGEPRITAVGGDEYALEVPCPETARCVEGLDVEVTRADPSGPWSIVRVSNAGLMVGNGSEPLVVDGPTVSFDIRIPDDRSAHVGIVATNGCREASSYEVGLDAGRFELEVPEPTADDPACSDVGAGYAFVYVTDDTTEPVGDPLLEAAAIEYPWLTIVPIHLVMEQVGPVASPTSPAGEAADVLTITCDSEGTSIDHSIVAAGPGGVAIFTSPYSQRVSLLFDGVDKEVLVVDDAAWMLDLPPGPHTVGCIYEGDLVLGEATFEVVDPGGHWTDPELICPQPASTDFDAGPIDLGEDPDAALLAAAEEILRADTPSGGSVMFGGYPASPDHRWVVVVTDDGKVIGRVGFTANGREWYPDGYQTCEGSAIF